MQTSKQCQLASFLSFSIRPHKWSSPAVSTDSFQSPSSTQLLILSGQHFSIACPFFLHCTFKLYCNRFPMAKMYCMTKEKKNLTFLGFCKITPSNISLVILLYRQTDRQTEDYSNTSKATLTWTVNRQIMHLICTLNNSSYQRLLNFPT